MSDFFDPPLFGAPFFPEAALLGGVQGIGTQYRASGVTFGYHGTDAMDRPADPYGPTPEYPIESVPWGMCVTSDENLQSGPVTDPAPTAPVATTPTDLEILQAQVAAMGLLVAGFQATIDALSPGIPALQTAADGAAMEVRKATISFATYTRRLQATPPLATAGDVAAAQARVDAANLAAATANDALAAASLTLLTAQQGISDRAENFHELVNQLLAAEQAAFAAALEYTLAQLNYSNQQTAAGASGDGSQQPYTYYRLTTLFGPTVSARQPGVIVHGQYRHTLSLPDDIYEALGRENCSVLHRWNEVTRTTPGVVHPGTGDNPDVTVYNESEPQYDVAAQDESYSSGGVQQADKTWLITGTLHDVAAPAFDDYVTDSLVDISVLGAALLPACSANIEAQGAESFRQGWSEFATAAGQPPRRYLSMQASKAPGAPQGASFAGAVSWVTPDPPNDDGSPDLTVLTEQDGYPPLGFPAAPTTARPLVARTTLAPGTPLPAAPDDLATPFDGASVLDPVTRVVSSPAGLQWTLSNEQSAGAFLGDAQAVRDAAWPDPPPPDPDAPPTDPDAPSVPSDAPPVAPAPRGLLAINFQSADGDHVVAQRMRFKLTYAANDSRFLPASTFSVTHRWAYRRCNLLTGVITTEPYSKTISYPVAVQVPASAASPPGTPPVTRYDDSTQDTDWTEITAGENESVELVLLPGTNDDPHSFSLNGVLSVVAS